MFSDHNGIKLKVSNKKDIWNIPKTLTIKQNTSKLPKIYLEFIRELTSKDNQVV